MQRGAIILCGGKSSRMGRDKATLPFGSEMLLHRMIRLLSQVVDNRRIVVVTAAGQHLPPVPAEVIVTHDRNPDRGPLEGLSAGLTAIPREVDAVYVTSCDAPLLVPNFVARLFELLEDNDVVVPFEGEQLHPLAAVYRPTVLNQIHVLLESDHLRLRSLFDNVKTRAVAAERFLDVDPNLQSLVNLNSPDDYREALGYAGDASD